MSRRLMLLPLLALLLSGFMQGDANRAVRRAIERQYEVLERAVETRDLALFESIRTEDFHTVDLQGRPQSTEQMRERTRLLLSVIQPPIDAEFEIVSITMTDRNTAVVTVNQTFSRRQMVMGQLHGVATRVTQDETWVRTRQGWKLRFVGNERDFFRFLNGRRVRPTGPLDPDAVGYDPEGTHASPAEREVRALERRWLDAYERHDATAMGEIVGDEFSITFPDGQVQTKGQLLRALRADPPPFAGYRFHTRDVLSRAFGETVVLTGIIVSETTREGRPHREESTYTDTWVRRDGRWQVVASHLSNAPAP